MRIVVMVFAFLIAVQPLTGAQLKFNLSQYPLNSLPKEFQSLVTGTGSPGDWKIIAADLPSLMPSANSQTTNTTRGLVLAQMATDPADEHFPLLLLGNDSFDDFTASTRFRIVAGQREQMAGLAFRVQNERNYYIARLSALGNNIRFYKFVEGQRSEPIGVDLPIATGTWHELKVDCKGNTIRIFVDNKEPMPALTDYSFNRGKVALWTKSDSVAHFVDFTVNYTPREKLADSLVRQAMEKNHRLLGIKIYAYVGQPPDVKIIASTNPNEVGIPGGEVERDVIGRNLPYAGKTGSTVSATIPLHDRNGEVVAAVRVVMTPIRGQSDQQILARGLPIVKSMQPGIRTLADLVEP
jgi:hypothetical protein